MAKKNFSDGLESIFGDEENRNEEVSIVTKTAEEGKAGKKGSGIRRKKRSSKDFTSDLDSLLQEALNESVEQHVKSQKKEPLAKSGNKKLQRKGRIKRTLSGLDALIRQTVESGTVEVEEVSSGGSKPKKKRVTFTFDREKVEKLKSIARLEKAYIRDIMDELVSEYIEKYEKGNKNE